MNDAADPAEVAFSVYIPVHNGARWVSRAIESVLAQTHPRWELIIGDNQSTDRTVELAEGFADARIRVQHFDRFVGVSENHNRTNALASFPWLVALGVDDRLAPGCLERMAAEIAAGTTAGIQYSLVQMACRRVDEEGRARDIPSETSSAKHPLHYQLIETGTYDARAWVLANAQPGITPWMVGAQAIWGPLLVEAGGFRPEFGPHDDLELAVRLSAYGPVRYVDEPLLDYTVRSDSMTSELLMESLVARDPMVTIGHAWASAMVAHARIRHVTSQETKAVNAAVARGFLQRALRHRQATGGLGRRGAVADVWHAALLSPTTLASPIRLAAAVAAVAAPRWLLRRATAMGHQRGALVV